MRALLVTCVVFFLFASVAIAGSDPDPNLGDSHLGNAGKFRYASQTGQLNQGNLGYSFATAGCGTGSARTVGGGFQIKGAKPGKRHIAVSRPTDYLDSDVFPDDGWDVTGFGGPSGTLTSFSICSASGHPQYRTQGVPGGSSPVRTASVRCGRGRHVVGGGAFIASSLSYLNSSYPYDGGDKDKAPDDGWTARVYDTGGGQGSFEVYAVCEKLSSDSFSYAATTQKLKKHQATSRRLNCPGGEHATGGGVRLAGPGRDAHLEGAYPYDSADKGKTPDDGFKLQAFNDRGSKKKVTSTVICIG